MVDNPLPLTRADLAKFLPDLRAIRAFEALLNLIPNNIDPVDLDAGNASAQADEALSTLHQVADSLQVIALQPSNTMEALAYVLESISILQKQPSSIMDAVTNVLNSLNAIALKPEGGLSALTQIVDAFNLIALRPCQELGTMAAQSANLVNVPLFRMVVSDNLATAYRVGEAANDYIAFDTTNGSEAVNLGNTTTNPVINVLGSSGLNIETDFGMANVGPQPQQSNIPTPVGGVVVDIEARAAVDAIIATLETFGFTAP